jgi:phosphate-selective porin OprO/OprP
MRFMLGVAMAAGLATAASADDAETARQSEQAVTEKQALSLDVDRVDYLQKDVDDAKLGDPDTFRVYWKQGLRLDSGDKSFKLKIGGRIMADFGFISENEDLRLDQGGGHDGDQEDYVEFRRARLYMAGDIYETITFKAQYDFAGGDADFKDVYVGVKKIPYAGTLKIGHFKEPFSLEELTSSKYITFMERSLPLVFAPSRNVGFGVMNTFIDGQMSAALGVFKTTDDYGEGFYNGEWAITGRLTGTPWFENKGEQCLHVGLSLSYRSNPNDSFRYRQRPECHGTDRFVDTGTLVAVGDDNVQTFLLGPEVAFVYGPASIQAEYIMANVTGEFGPTIEDPSFSGFYVYGSFFVTGEHRAYKQSKAAFDRVKPKNNFSLDEGGLGALELAVRFSMLDLSDEDIYGGEETNITGGVNWYLNPNMRVMLNYVNASVDELAALNSPKGKANIFMMRFQLDF